MNNEILELISLLEDVYESNDNLVWEEIFYMVEKLKENLNSNN